MEGLNSKNKNIKVIVVRTSVILIILNKTAFLVFL